MNITVPMDVYDSPTEMVAILPLGWVQKDSLHLHCEAWVLHLTGKRQKPEIKSSLVPVQEQCFWWNFEKTIDIWNNIVYENIRSELSAENILTIVIPKNIPPEEIVIQKEGVSE